MRRKQTYRIIKATAVLVIQSLLILDFAWATGNGRLMSPEQTTYSTLSPTVKIQASAIQKAFLSVQQLEKNSGPLQTISANNQSNREDKSATKKSTLQLTKEFVTKLGQKFLPIFINNIANMQVAAKIGNIHKRVRSIEWADGVLASFAGIFALGVIGVGIVGFIYDWVLFFDLIGFLRTSPFNYGWFKTIIASTAISTIVLGLIGKTLVFFIQSGEGEGEKEEEPGSSDEHYEYLYELIFGGLALIGLPFILYSNWGMIGQNFTTAVSIFTEWNFHYLLAGLLGFSVIIQLFMKAVGIDGEKSFGEKLYDAFLATIVAPIGEEVAFRYILFNLSQWFWVSVMGFTEPFSFTLPWLGISVGFDLPLGIFIAIFANADLFFAEHGKGKWFHHWFMGAITSYTYYKTGILLLPIYIHFVWNGIAAIFDLILGIAIPLNARVSLTATKKTLNAPESANTLSEDGTNQVTRNRNSLLNFLKQPTKPTIIADQPVDVSLHEETFLSDPGVSPAIVKPDTFITSMPRLALQSI